MLEKLFAVVPLVCAVPPIVTLAPVEIKFATKEVMIVPLGTVTVIFVPVINPVACGVEKPKDVINLEEDKVTTELDAVGGIKPWTFVELSKEQPMIQIMTKINLIFLEALPNSHLILIAPNWLIVNCGYFIFATLCISLPHYF